MVAGVFEKRRGGLPAKASTGRGLRRQRWLGVVPRVAAVDIVAMPQLGETVTEGTITTWSKAVGDPVALDDALFEVSTEKVDTEVPSAVTGYLRAILVAEGDTVPIGTPVAVVTATADEDVDLSIVGHPGAPDEAPGSGAIGPEREGGHRRPGTTGPSLDDVAVAGRGGSTGHGPPATSARSPSEVLSPAVRRLLDEHDLAVDDVAGSGRDGRITRADVLAGAARVHRFGARSERADTGASGDTAGEGDCAHVIEVGDDADVVDLSRARLATAEHMVRSLATAAHALVVVEVDYSGVDLVRRAAGLSYLPFVARAVVDAIAEFPHVNASFDGDRLVIHRRVHLGVAVDVEREALVVPVVRHADDLRLTALAATVTELADRTRRRRLPGDAFSGGTFTITNVGSYGTLVTAPIINQPQVAILSTDGVRMAPVAVRTDNGDAGSTSAWGIAVHPVGNLSMSFDHRAVDGAYAAAFLARVRDLVQTRDWSGEVDP